MLALTSSLQRANVVYIENFLPYPHFSTHPSDLKVN